MCLTLDKQSWIPTSGSTLREWCIHKDGTNLGKKVTRAVVVLVSWELWKHQNGIVFDNATPSTRYIINRLEVEGRVWKDASLLKGNVDAFLGRLSLGMRGNS